MSVGTTRERVCFPFVGDLVGGSHISALKLVRSLAGSRYEPMVLVHEEGELASYLERQEIPFQAAPVRLGKRGPGRQGAIADARWALAAAAAVPRLSRFLREEGVRVVHTNDGRMHALWAPAARQVELVLDAGAFAMTPEAGGYHSLFHLGAGEGTLYRFRLDGRGPFPDPVSRFQPEGVHGPSEVVAPATFAWTDRGWGGLERPGQVLYEMHVGTFTPEGTWDAASHRLPELRDLGIRVLSADPGDMDTPLHALAVPGANPATLKRPETAAEELLEIISGALSDGASPEPMA